MKKNNCKTSFTSWKAHIHSALLPNLLCEGDILHLYPDPMCFMIWNHGQYAKVNY
jgi:hypothetical protein